MKKYLRYIGVAMLAVAILVSVIFIFPRKVKVKTWDLRGVVEAVTMEAESNTVWLDVRLTFGETSTKIRVLDSTKVRIYGEERIQPGEIRVGDHISLNVKTRTALEDYYTAKKIQIDLRQ